MSSETDNKHAHSMACALGMHDFRLHADGLQYCLHCKRMPGTPESYESYKKAMAQKYFRSAVEKPTPRPEPIPLTKQGQGREGDWWPEIAFVAALCVLGIVTGTLGAMIFNAFFK